MGEKIGIMGGTFNPIHNGHLLLAEAAREFLELEKIIFMPSGNSYMKEEASILEGGIRAHMIELAIEKNPCFCLSRMEIEREGATYTCDTLKELKSRDPENEYYFILGADNLLSMEGWRNTGFILQNCVIAAAVRGTGTGDRVERAAEHLMNKYQADIRILPARFIDISSSEIRARLREGRSIRYMVPESVFACIEDNRLYQPV